MVTHNRVHSLHPARTSHRLEAGISIREDDEVLWIFVADTEEFG